MKKKLIAAGLGLCLLAGNMTTALAENPKAEEYRQITAGGVYHIKYKNTLGHGFGMIAAIAINGNKRFLSTGFTMPGLFMLGTNEKINPSAFYDAGKYYQFLNMSKKEVRLATDAELFDPNIDPTENWDTVKTRLTLPGELKMFAPQDNFDGKANTVPVFISSGTEQAKNGEIQFDKYVRRTTNEYGAVISETFYYVYYKEDKLHKVKTTIKQKGGQEVKVSQITIMEFDNTIPKNMQGLPSGCKIYKAGMGDMDDLLDNKVLIETVAKGADEE